MPFLNGSFRDEILMVNLYDFDECLKQNATFFKGEERAKNTISVLCLKITPDSLKLSNTSYANSNRSANIPIFVHFYLDNFCYPSPQKGSS